MQNDLGIISRRLQQTMLNLPAKVGIVIVNFSKQRFREQNWIDGSTLPWKRRAGNKDPGRAVLVKAGRLRRSIRIVRTTSNSVTMGSDTPYAAAHNEGFNGVVTVKPYTRKRFVKEKVFTGKVTKRDSKGYRNVLKVVGEIQVKQHTKRLTIPQRRFMGRSLYMNNQVTRLITSEIMKIFK